MKRVFKIEEKETNLKNYIKSKVKVLFIKNFATFVDVCDGDIFIVEGYEGNVAEVSYETAKILLEKGVVKLL